MAWASGEVGMGIRGLPKLSRKIAFCQIPQRVAWLDRASLSAYLSPVTSRPYLAVVHYDGAQFVGWQRQRQGRTVQGEFEAVLERLMGGRTTAIGAGRTDTGVHATGQGVGFTASERWAADVAAWRSPAGPRVRTGRGWISRSRPTDSCTAWCASSWASWWTSPWGGGRRPTSPACSMRRTIRRSARPLRPKGCIWRPCVILLTSTPRTEP